MSEIVYPWTSKKVMRYFWNGKGYAARKHVARAIAKKEAVIWALTVVRPLFGEQFTNTLANGFGRGNRTGPSGMFIGLVFGNIGSNGNNLYTGISYAWGEKSPWQHWVETRCALLLNGDPLLIEREARDEESPWGESWSVSPNNFARGLDLGLPFPSLVLPGKVLDSRAQIIESLHDIIDAHLQTAEHWHGPTSDYEIHCIKSPIDHIATLLEERQYDPKLGASDIDW